MRETLKNLSAMQETQLRSLGQKDPLEKGMATHSSILAWRILWTEEPGGLQSMESERVGHDLATRHQKQSTLQNSQWPSVLNLAVLASPRDEP